MQATTTTPRLPRRRSGWTGVLLAAALACGMPAVAQDAPPAGRNFPTAALRGTLEITAPPMIRLDGRTETLAPGARIRSPQNLLVLSAGLVGRRYLVNYQRDAAGMVSDVWLLTPPEAAEKRAGAGGSRGFLSGAGPVSDPSRPGR